MSSSKRILVVDDEEMNRDLIEALLEDFGHEAELAESGVEALAKLKPGFDLVFLDVMMPGMDGYEVCRRLKKNTRLSHIPVIFITAKGEVEDETKGLEMGAVDYIFKPFRPSI
ncbi:MAG: response regulator, partial [Deltaproteobacteria bacterium]|nr:response regulator [Deltaproteobacteria bacterium]